MKENVNQLKKEVLKKLFVILPFEEADNLKIVRKSAEKIIEGRYVGLDTIEKAIDLTLQDVCEEIKRNPNFFLNDDAQELFLKKFQGEEE